MYYPSYTVQTRRGFIIDGIRSRAEAIRKARLTGGRVIDTDPTPPTRLSNKGDGVYATADGLWIAERTESAYGDDTWWTVKRITPDGFGDIRDECETLGEARKAITRLIEREAGDTAALATARQVAIIAATDAPWEVTA